MDRKMDSLLKRSWDSAIFNLRPALATTCVARNLEFWLAHLKGHLESGSSREELVESFSTLVKAVGYVADASAESIRLSARTSALVNCARRALWLKSWSGDVASKLRLCSIPVDGDLLFGPELEATLERTADKKKSFPETRRNQPARRFFRGQKSQEGDPKPKKHWQGAKGRGRGGVLFNPPKQTPSNKPQ